MLRLEAEETVVNLMHPIEINPVLAEVVVAENVERDVRAHKALGRSTHVKPRPHLEIINRLTPPAGVEKDSNHRVIALPIVPNGRKELQELLRLLVIYTLYRHIIVILEIT